MMYLLSVCFLGGFALVAAVVKMQELGGITSRGAILVLLVTLAFGHVTRGLLQGILGVKNA